MDYFQYTIKMQEIDNAKTLKAKEFLARELTSTLDTICEYGDITAEHIIPIEFTYKCLTKVLKLYNGSKSLPAFIFNKMYNTQKKLLYYYCTTQPLPSFTTIVDIFQYSSTIEFHRFNTILEPFIKIIGNNKLPFYVKYNITIPRIYNTLLSSRRNISTTIYDGDVTSGTLYVEHIKSTLPKNKKYTVIENILKESYEIIATIDVNILENITKAQEISANLVEITATMASKVN